MSQCEDNSKPWVYDDCPLVIDEPDSETDSVFDNNESRDNSSCYVPNVNSTPVIPPYKSVPEATAMSTSSGVFGIDSSSSSEEECQMILDSHIESTIDKFTDDHVACYRPVAQESYDNQAQPPPSLITNMRKQLQMMHVPKLVVRNNSHCESDSAYSGSPSPDLKTRTRIPNRPGMSLQPSLSDEYIMPCHFLSDHSDFCPDLAFHNPPPAYSVNPHVTYLPPVWSQLHQIRDEFTRDIQVIPSPSPSMTIHHHPLPGYGTDYLTFTPSHLSVSRSESRSSCVTYDSQPSSKPSTSSTVWRLQCKDCHRRFNSQHNLENHIASVHKGIRPFKCGVCDKAFAQRATLRTHLRTHTGEKPYKCQICDRKFADLSTCKKHQRVHDGQKPYVCDLCGKRFSQSGNMLRHKEGHEKKESRINLVTIQQY